MVKRGNKSSSEKECALALTLSPDQRGNKNTIKNYTGKDYHELVFLKPGRLMYDDDTVKILLHYEDIYKDNFITNDEFPQELMGALIETDLFGWSSWAHNILYKYKCDHGDAYITTHGKYRDILKNYYESHARSFVSIIGEELPLGVSLHRKRLAAEKSSTEEFRRTFTKYVNKRTLSRRKGVYSMLGVTKGYLQYYMDEGYNIPLEVQLQILQGVGATNLEIKRIIEKFYETPAPIGEGHVPESFASLHNNYLKDEMTPKESESALNLPVGKPAFSFNLFGYEFSIKAKKKELPEPINLSDEFPDEIEY